MSEGIARARRGTWPRTGASTGRTSVDVRGAAHAATVPSTSSASLQRGGHPSMSEGGPALRASSTRSWSSFNGADIRRCPRAGDPGDRLGLLRGASTGRTSVDVRGFVIARAGARLGAASTGRTSVDVRGAASALHKPSHGKASTGRTPVDVRGLVRKRLVKAEVVAASTGGHPSMSEGLYGISPHADLAGLALQRGGHPSMSEGPTPSARWRSGSAWSRFNGADIRRCPRVPGQSGLILGRVWLQRGGHPSMSEGFFCADRNGAAPALQRGGHPSMSEGRP